MLNRSESADHACGVVRNGCCDVSAPRTTVFEMSAALLLTGHHAQASAVLDNSRALPQGGGCAAPKRCPGGEGRAGASRDIPMQSVLDRRSQSTLAGLQGPYTE